MTDVNINLKIPTGKAVLALQGYLQIYPNTEMTDDEEPVKKYTNKEWAIESIRRNIVRDIRRGLQMKANEEARIDLDDKLVTL